MLETVSSFTATMMAFIATLFAAMSVVQDRPLTLAVSSMLVAVPAIHMAVFPSEGASCYQIAIHVGVSGVLGWFCFAHPQIGIVGSWRNDNWVQRFKR